MKLKIIFFDVYQTLLYINNNSKNEKAWSVFLESLKKHGVNINSSQFQKLLTQKKQNYYASVNDPEMKSKHHNLLDLINDIFLGYDIQLNREELVELIWKFRQLHHPEIKIYPKITEILTELSNEYTLAIASYTQDCYTRKELEKFNISKYFSHFLFSSEIGYRKTNQNFYKTCLEKTNSQPEECLMIGDNYLQDIATPKKLGLKAILIKNPLTNNIIEDIKPDSVIKLEEINNLPLIIKSLSQ